LASAFVPEFDKISYNYSLRVILDVDISVMMYASAQQSLAYLFTEFPFLVRAEMAAIASGSARSANLFHTNIKTSEK
jgi:phage FluMu gp28-like protein